MTLQSEVCASLPVQHFGSSYQEVDDTVLTQVAQVTHLTWVDFERESRFFTKQDAYECRTRTRDGKFLLRVELSAPAPAAGAPVRMLSMTLEHASGILAGTAVAHVEQPYSQEVPEGEGAKHLQFLVCSGYPLERVIMRYVEHVCQTY